MSEPIHSSLLPTHLARAEGATTRWFFKAVRGTTIEQVMDPNYWVHVAARLRRTPNGGIYDEIRVVAEDGAFDIELTVVAIDQTAGLWAEVRPLRIWEGKATQISAAQRWPDGEGYSIEFSKPQRWRILDSMKNLVAKDFATEDDALSALANIKAAKVAKAA